MAIEDILWALAQEQVNQPRLPGVFPAFTRYVDGDYSMPNFGYCVAYSATQNQFGWNGLKFAVNHAMANSRVVGGWYNQNNGQFYFDSVRIYHTREAAIQAAIRNRQIGIYDLSSGTYIDVMNQATGSFVVRGRTRRFSIG